MKVFLSGCRSHLTGNPSCMNPPFFRRSKNLVHNSLPLRAWRKVSGLLIVEVSIYFCFSTSAKQIPNQYETVSGPGQEDVQPLGSRHEANVVILIAPREGGNHDFTLLALIVI